MCARKSRSGVAGGTGHSPPVVKIAKVLPVSCPTVVAFVSCFLAYGADFGVYAVEYNGGAGLSARIVSFAGVWLGAELGAFVWLVPGPQIVTGLARRGFAGLRWLVIVTACRIWFRP